MLLALPVSAMPFGGNGRADRLQEDLVKNGFENVAVILEDRHLIVTYENRIYRDEIRAAQEVLAILLPLLKEGIKITLIPQNQKIPLVAITLPADKYPAPVNGEAASPHFFSQAEVALDVEPFWRKVRALPKANSSAWKLDLVAHPQIRAQFGNRSDVVESQINFAPELNISFRNGMSLSLQYVIPLQNDFAPESDNWRPGLLALNQALRLPQNAFVAVSVGYFTKNRYGADLKIKKYFVNGRVALGANFGYTGYAAYLKGVWQYSTLDVLTALAQAEYRFARFDLSLRATYGQFLYQDKGGRFDIRRQFREVDIGFYVLKTGTGTNGGFNFSLPIFPPKHLSAGPIRVRTANSFPWEYRYWGLNDNGTQFNAGNSLDDYMKRLNPDYIKNR